jgi:5-formyltetrahydrofolate cyclo-ligase
MSSEHPPQRRLVRTAMREMRRSLPPSYRRACARALARRLAIMPEFRAARRVAAYLVNDGEIDPAPAIALAWRMRKRTLLPVVRRHGLAFARFDASTRLMPNRLGIPEPVTRQRGSWRHQAADLVLVPLVAFDAKGNRIGMGGGYYDRTFAALRGRAAWRRLRLVGIAYEEQRVERVEARPWDVPLHAVATPRTVYRFARDETVPGGRTLAPRAPRSVTPGAMIPTATFSGTTPPGATIPGGNGLQETGR